LAKKPDFNIILFLALYVLLLQGFYFYVGLATPGGRFSSPFLAQYFNIPQWLTIAAVNPSKWLIELSGYSVHQLNAANITITGSRGVTVAWGCLGVGAMALWFAFITAHRNMAKKRKLVWIVAGITFIYVVNIIRIIMIALSNYYNWHYIHNFNAHNSFNILTYVIIIIAMWLFAKKYNKNKKIKVEAGNTTYLDVPLK